MIIWLVFVYFINYGYWRVGVKYGIINLVFFVFVYKKGKCVILVFMFSVGVFVIYILIVNVWMIRSLRKYLIK